MMCKKTKLLLIVIFFILIFILYYLFIVLPKRDTLWKIVSQQCVSNQEKNQNPAPCLKVDLKEKYVLFKDKKGSFHDLLMPTYRISGIESAQLATHASTLFSNAWRERTHLKNVSQGMIKDSYLSLAKNSKYGRSQDQLHIHIACLKPYVYHIIEREEQNIGLTWQPFNEKINNRVYIAKRLHSMDLIKEDPFKALDNYIMSQGDRLGNYGLGLVFTKNGYFILLANQVNFMKLNFGSIGEIQDYQCSLSQE